ncbi:uncharacterized protein C8Q71DRAFT_117238 [Rhodofomes roseus]|uniref:Uncharacterized protein n=1 Tax=Rhodofomes roseus TaxID=34475 RepID=A0ABQ8KCQ1_9APHY|nr:uncharacterized protein C8Q71DRAFT_117238 [Rhodofomes roseus]KAH9835380.1 hypothetical protein C8Q71DRAFT_117238 [Rhodofomes roseus]
MIHPTFSLNNQHWQLTSPQISRLIFHRKGRLDFLSLARDRTQLQGTTRLGPRLCHHESTRGPTIAISGRLYCPLLRGAACVRCITHQVRQVLLLRLAGKAACSEPQPRGQSEAIVVEIAPPPRALDLESPPSSMFPHCGASARYHHKVACRQCHYSRTSPVGPCHQATPATSSALVSVRLHHYSANRSRRIENRDRRFVTWVGWSTCQCLIPLNNDSVRRLVSLYSLRRI